jgi:hypothetical protein
VTNHSNQGHSAHGSNGDLAAADGLTHDDLKKRFLEVTEGSSWLIEEPLDTGLWPTAGLSDDELTLLIDGLREVRRRELAGI